MSHNKLILTGPKQQSGAVLVVALVLLLLLTLTGVTSMSTTTSELKVASNQQAYNSSFEAAFSTIESVRRSDVDWTVIDKANYQTRAVSGPSGGGSFVGLATITYDHCMGAVVGTSLTIESQSGDSSAAFGRVVQEVVATGKAQNSAGQVIATNVQVNGVSIEVASCP